MLRVRIQLSKQDKENCKKLDTLHDAMVNVWTMAGATSEQITGMSALPWNFAPLGRHRKQDNEAHTLIVSTPDATLAKFLCKIKPADINYAQASTVEGVNFKEAEIIIEDDPSCQIRIY